MLNVGTSTAPVVNISDWVECYGEKHDEKTKINNAIHTTMENYNRKLESNDFNGAWE